MFMMKPIYIPQILQATDATVELAIDQMLDDLETLTPVRGTIAITHHLNYLEVTATVETIATLTCHRCLQNYNHRLQVETQELIWLDETESEWEERTDLNQGDFSEALSPRGYIEPLTWLYEQLSLAMPLQQVCSEACEGVNPELTQTQPLLDNRWSGLAALKQQLEPTSEETTP